MSEVQVSDTDIISRYEALAEITSELVLILRDNIVVECIRGDLDWLEPVHVKGRSLNELFPGEFLERIQPAIEMAAATPGVVERAAYVWRPESMPAWSVLGLVEPIWFEARLMASKYGEIVWTAHDVTARKRLQGKLSHQSQRDPLTGAYSRRTFMAVAEQVVSQALRYDGICSVALIDVDGFKNINENYSWDAGDQILQQIAATMYRMKRAADFIARYADDCFAVIMPETNHEQAMAAAERIKRMVSDIVVPYHTGDINCTVSVGVATIGGPEDNCTDMFRRAQENLIIATHSGGDRIEGEE